MITLLAITSDQHTNSTLGLCPPQGVRLDEGGEYKPSKAQRWTWECWRDYHAKIAALRKAFKAKLVYVINGDAVDGDHHGTSQIITRNVESQAYIADEVFGVVKALKPDAVHVVRGTEVHVGGSAAMEEALAKRLGAVRDPESEAWSTWHLRLEVNGIEVDFQHHCSVGGLKWTLPGGVARLAFRHWAERMEKGLPAAKLIIRSHKHLHSDSYDSHPTRAIVTPAWQLKTAHAHKVVPESIADIGGIAVIVHPSGQYEVRKYLYTPALPAMRTA